MRRISEISRLKSVDGEVTQHYAYDYNGNLISDSRRNITSIKYDNRNLPTEMIISSIFMAKSYKIEYKYDESGNRFRKKVYENEAISGESPIGWKLIKDEVYVRDAGGKEIAVYQNSTLDYYNIWGNGLEGKIKRDERGNLKYYYYKDHLGSVRAVMDGSFGTTVQAQDYEAWGDIFRTYTSDDISQNKFTSKERDAETGYDYFGARYYDSRIGNFLQLDPLSEKHVGWSPYNYVLRNPYILIDPDGKQFNALLMNNNTYNKLINEVKVISGYELGSDKSGNLRVMTDLGSKDKSQTARNLISKALGYETKGYYTITTTNDIPSQFFTNDRENTINLNENQTDAFENGAVQGLNRLTMGIGIVFLHEVAHTPEGINRQDDLKDEYDKGPIVEFENKIREELGDDWGQRQTYKGFVIGEDYNNAYLPFSRSDKNRISSFAHQLPIFQYIKFNPQYNP